MTYDIQIRPTEEEIGCYHCDQPVSDPVNPMLVVIRLQDGEEVDRFYFHTDCAAYRLTNY